MTDIRKGKVVVISAPSGCGKSTIINAVRELPGMDLQFSVSATNRDPRPGETDGVSYYFLTDDEFRRRIDAGDFVEYCEVYPGRFYGTLKSEVERTRDDGHDVILDIDVVGGVNVKEMFGDEALSIFIMPPSVDELRRRLESRGTDSEERIAERVGRAEYEIGFAPKYDRVVVNDDLSVAVEETSRVIADFTGRSL
ncbi:MAG: guanylate kinase [Muribaculaceae bacterium]|nr:guanylate kinase [Muribaculaceae bacterium]MDE6610304.1 guanylate kinase [Muribaculaceae bacterium]